MYKLPSTDPQATRCPYNSDEGQPEEITPDQQYSSQTTFYSTSPVNDFCDTDYPRCLWHSPPTDKFKIHFRKNFFHTYWYVTFSSQMSLSTEMLEVSQTSKDWIQREYVRLGKLFYGFMLYSFSNSLIIHKENSKEINV